MLLNQQNLSIVFTGFKTAFQNGLGQHESQVSQVALTVPSSTREEKYGWLGKFPNLREWLGDRVLNKVKAHDYAIRNKTFEMTISVDREDIEDDQFGIYAPLFQEMGMSTAAHPDQLGFGLLKSGFDGSKGVAYDGQFFFDTDHPVLDEAGNEISVANTDGGAGTGWYLMDLSRPMRPIIWQVRRDYDLVSLDKMDDENVFMRKEFVYGVDGRVNAGYGLWQMSWGSRQPLNDGTYGTARESLMAMKGDYGRPLGIRPTHLVVPPSLEKQGLEILNAERNAAGATNVYRNTAQLLVVPWLA